MIFSVLANNETALFELGSMDCIVVGVYGDELSAIAKQIDELCEGIISQVIQFKELGEAPGETLILYSAGAVATRRIMLVQLGPVGKLTLNRSHKAALSAGKALLKARCHNVAWCLTEHTEHADLLKQSVLALHESDYRFSGFKTEDGDVPNSFANVALLVQPDAEHQVTRSLMRADALGRGVRLCRDLGNLPPNVCTPAYLASAAVQLADCENVETEVLEQAEIEALQMNAFLAVGKGSTEAPKLLTIRYSGASPDLAPIVLVGKGITFDSGGISIKPGEAMDEMKYDMCGAAAVLGTLKAAISMRLPLNIYGVIPACENMPSGDALKPGDIITSMSGKTIEVLNTDAEGRLILCDTLTYVERFNPSAVIDVATLTGSCLMALGDVHSGLFAREQGLADDLLAASKASGDTVWQMPMDEVYHEGLKSNFADLQNIGPRPAGAVTAACFLENFTRKYPWAHLDIAGTAWEGGSKKGATGRPVKLLTEYLLSQCQQ